MTTATKSIKMDNGNTITVTITRTVSDKVSYSDGWNIPMGREKYESMEISLYHAQAGKTVKGNSVSKLYDHNQSDKDARKQGAVAKIGGTGTYLGQKAYDAVMTLIADKDARKQGAVAKIGGTGTYLGQKAYDAVMTLIADTDAECGKTDEFAALEREEAERKAAGEENMRRMEAEQREREKHPGWCNKCHSYCYGDCNS